MRRDESLLLLRLEALQPDPESILGDLVHAPLVTRTPLVALVDAENRTEGNVLFNDALNTFYLRLYGIRHMVKDHSDSERKPAATTWATLFD